MTFHGQHASNYKNSIREPYLKITQKVSHNICFMEQSAKCRDMVGCFNITSGSLYLIY